MARRSGAGTLANQLDCSRRDITRYAQPNRSARFGNDAHEKAAAASPQVSALTQPRTKPPVRPTNSHRRIGDATTGSSSNFQESGTGGMLADTHSAGRSRGIDLHAGCANHERMRELAQESRGPIARFASARRTRVAESGVSLGV
jgi:hypothetical protein